MTPNYNQLKEILRKPVTMFLQLTDIRDDLIFFGFAILRIVFVFVRSGVRVCHGAVLVRVTDGDLFLSQPATRQSPPLVRNEWFTYMYVLART